MTFINNNVNYKITIPPASRQMLKPAPVVIRKYMNEHFNCFGLDGASNRIVYMLKAETSRGLLMTA